MRFLLLLALAPSIAAAQSSADFLSRLPDGEEKRRFILDCTGCHQFDSVTVGARSRDDWAEAVRRMLGYAGASTGFPVISAYRDADRTADWLYQSLSRPVAAPAPAPRGTLGEGRAQVTEFPMSAPGDLLHDVAIDATGRIVVTGMFSHVMYHFDPASGRLDTIALPARPAQPRAVELDSAGNWYVLLGAPRQIARRDARSGQWTTHDIGMYPHSIGLDAAGRAWFNGHFTVAPEQIGALEPPGQVRTFEVPAHPTMGAPGGPIPYELRVAADGTVWMSELQGNRMVSYQPSTGGFQTFTLPTPFSGPRRFDLDGRGIVWIPAYGAGMLVRLDPATGRFTEWPLPVRDAAPYVVRVDPRNGRVWIGTGAADVVLSFDPSTSAFTRYALPSRGAMIRHMAIDPRNGDVWLAYGASPGRISARIARLSPPQ